MDSRDATEWRRSRFSYAEFTRLREMDSRDATEWRQSRFSYAEFTRLREMDSRDNHFPHKKD